MTTVSHTLIEAYQKTSYCVDAPAGRFCIHVGDDNPELKSFLAQNKAEQWAYVSAENPGSVPLSVEQNRLRNIALFDEIKSQGWNCFEGEAIPINDSDKAQYTEASFLVLNIDAESALTLARTHGQFAVVVGKGALAELKWC